MVEIPKKEPFLSTSFIEAIKTRENFTKEECLEIGRTLIGWLQVQDKHHVFIQDFFVKYYLFDSFLKTHIDRYPEFAKQLEEAKFIEQANIIKQAAFKNLDPKFCVEYLRQHHGWQTKVDLNKSRNLKTKSDREIEDEIRKLTK